MKVRLIDIPLAIPRYRQIRLPTVAAEFTPYADVEINDENIEPVDFSPVDLVGFTAQAYNAPRAIHLSKKFRQIGIPTVVGGPYATALPDQALKHFDAVVAGEVEGLGERIISDLSAGRLSGVYRLEEAPRNWGQRIPRRDLQKADEYYWFNYPIELTRGCPHRCSFCFARYANPGFRTRSLASIARQVEQWDHGLIEAVDWNFAADREFTLQVCRLFEEMGVGGWFGEATLRALDDEELLRALSRSNFKEVFVGLESIEEKALRSVNKEFNLVPEYRRIIRRIQDHGIFVHAGIMWGLDGQTEGTFDAMAEFCDETGLFLVSSNITTYFPGTPEHSKLREEGRLLTEEPRKFDGTHVVVEPDALSVEQVYDGARRFLARFYGLRSMLKRSIQTPNYDLFQLLAFWNLNLAYRDYYRMWGRRLGGEQIPLSAPPDEMGSLPHVGGRMPRIYTRNDARRRRAHRWYMAWYRAPREASAIWTGGLVLLAAAVSILAFRQVREVTGSHSPVLWPPAAPVLGAFVLATLVSTWLVTRLARIGVADSGASPDWAAQEQGERCSGFFLKPTLMLCAVLATSLPLFLCAFSFAQGNNGWAFFTCALAAVFFMRSWSAVTAGNPWDKSPLRVAHFLLFYPTLDFETAYRFDATREPLTRHLPTALRGLWKSAGGLALLPVLSYLTIRNVDDIAFGMVGTLARVACLYLLLAGVMEVLTAYWRAWGFVVEDPFAPRPFGPATLSGLWRRWNVPMRRWLVRHVYVPLGGRRRPMATVATFLTSGLIFGVIFSPVVDRFPHEMLMFFGASGLLTATENLVWRTGQPTKAWLAVHFALAAALLLVTARWFFAISDRMFM